MNELEILQMIEETHSPNFSLIPEVNHYDINKIETSKMSDAVYVSFLDKEQEKYLMQFIPYEEDEGNILFSRKKAQDYLSARMQKSII